MTMRHIPTDRARRELIHRLKGRTNADLATMLADIHLWLDGEEWDSDTASNIAEVFTREGIEIREPTEG